MKQLERIFYYCNTCGNMLMVFPGSGGIAADHERPPSVAPDHAKRPVPLTTAADHAKRPIPSPECCGAAMVTPVFNQDGSLELSHWPRIYKDRPEAPGKILIRVGTIQHPMDANHYLKWILCLQDERLTLRQLRPGDAPEIQTDMMAGNPRIAAYACCSKDGLWAAIYGLPKVPPGG
jgi:superoxide reductase